MTRQEQNEQFETRVKQHLKIDLQTPIELKGHSTSGVYVYSLGKVIGHLSNLELSELKETK